MQPIVVVDRPADWPHQLAGVEIVTARDYLTEERWIVARGIRVYNLCRSYRYQSAGYYVSLLAAARRHRPFPDLMTVLDMRSRALVRTAGDELEDVIQKSLTPIGSERFTLSIYFRRNMAQRHARLAARLFELFPAPLLRAQFAREDGTWRLTSLAPVPTREVPPHHWDFVLASAREYFSRPRYRGRASRAPRFHMAILHDPDEELAPSDSKALKRFQQAAERIGFGVERVRKEDYSRLAEFDALFIRETTYVDHHTFRFAQRAESEGLTVIDDPQSILRCTNKVFLAEALAMRGVPIPRTWITDSKDAAEAAERIGFPCVLKHPDSSFSQGVLKCQDAAQFEEQAALILERTELFVAQEFLPSTFDWRIGVFEGQPLYACRYHMAKSHWQIVRKTSDGNYRYGKVEPVPLTDVPKVVVRTAVRATKVIGNGLYGVDLKQIGKKVYVIEVNDNPSIDAGCEDAILEDQLYDRIMEGFLRRVEAAKAVAE